MERTSLPGMKKQVMGLEETSGMEKLSLWTNKTNL